MFKREGLIELGKVILTVTLIALFCATFYCCMNCGEIQSEMKTWRMLRRIEAYRKYQEEHPTDTPKPTYTPQPTIDPYTYVIPVVGMAEENINKTRYSRELYCTFDHFNGKTHKRYYADGAGTERDPQYLLVVCEYDVVTLVIDRRHDPWRDPPKTVSPKKKSGGSSGNTKKKDDYYGDAEEFYYDHIDEFADFDEAEEYYNEHYY